MNIIKKNQTQIVSPVPKKPDRKRFIQGSAVVIGFVILLFIIAIIATLWAFVGLPEQIENSERAYSTNVQNSFLEYKISADNLRVNDIEGARTSILLPAINRFSGGSVQFEPKTGDVITISADDLQYQKFETSRISTTSSGRSFTHTIGYENGGVYFEENGVPTWITPGLLQVYPFTDTGTSVTEFVFISLEGKPETSGNRYVPLSSTYIEKTDHSPILWYSNATLTLTSGDQTRLLLWYTMFEETKHRWNSYTSTQRGGSFVTLTTELGSNFAKLTLENQNKDLPSAILLRNASYNVTILPIVGVSENPPVPTKPTHKPTPPPTETTQPTPKPTDPPAKVLTIHLTKDATGLALPSFSNTGDNTKYITSVSGLHPDHNIIGIEIVPGKVSSVEYLLMTLPNGVFIIDKTNGDVVESYYSEIIVHPGKFTLIKNTPLKIQPKPQYMDMAAFDSGKIAGKTFTISSESEWQKYFPEILLRSGDVLDSVTLKVSYTPEQYDPERYGTPYALTPSNMIIRDSLGRMVNHTYSIEYQPDNYWRLQNNIMAYISSATVSITDNWPPMKDRVGTFSVTTRDLNGDYRVGIVIQGWNDGMSLKHFFPNTFSGFDNKYKMIRCDNLEDSLSQFVPGYIDDDEYYYRHVRAQIDVYRINEGRSFLSEAVDLELPPFDAQSYEWQNAGTYIEFRRIYPFFPNGITSVSSYIY